MRRTYWYDPERKEVVEITAGAPQLAAPNMWGKVTSEGEQYAGLAVDWVNKETGQVEKVDISSRRKRSEFMAREQLTDPGDYRGHAGSVAESSWSKAAEQRRRFFTGETDSSSGKRREMLREQLRGSRR